MTSPASPSTAKGLAIALLAATCLSQISCQMANSAINRLKYMPGGILGMDDHILLPSMAESGSTAPLPTVNATPAA